MDRQQRLRILVGLLQLAKDPFLGKALKAEWEGFFSLRLWSKRIIYHVCKGEKLVRVSDIFNATGSGEFALSPLKRSFTIRDLPPAERPRERLQRLGTEALSSQELLALILGKGARGESVLLTAQRLLSRFGSLSEITQASLTDLQSVKGIGLAKAAQLQACLELARRQEATETPGKASAREKGKRNNFLPAEIFRLLRPKISHYNQEHFLVLSFDAKNQLLGMDTVSVGTLNASLVHPRETYEPAIRRHAARIVVAHNHPSQDPMPSQDDIAATKRLALAGKILDIELVDHLVVAQNDFFSFKEKNLL